MATKKVYVGSVGPFLYDDSVNYDGTAIPMKGLYTEGKIQAGTPPSSSEDVVRLGDLSGSTFLYPFMALDTTGNQVIAGVANMNIDSVEVSNAIYSLAADEITFTKAGTYLIAYTICHESTDIAGGDRADVHVYAEDDDGGAYATSPGSHSTAYNRETVGLDSSVNHCTFLLVLANAGKKMRLRIERVTGTANIDTIANYSNVTILKIA